MKRRHRTPLDPYLAACEIGRAIAAMKAARCYCYMAGANHAARYISRALRSVEGAHRHAMRVWADARERSTSSTSST